MTAPRLLPAEPPAPGRRRRARRTGVLLAAGALGLTGCGLLSPDDAGVGTTTPPVASATSAAPDPGQAPPAGPAAPGTGAVAGDASTSSSANPATPPATRAGYPGHERVERALRTELGEDAQISSHDAEATGRILASRDVDTFGPVTAGVVEPCRSLREEATREILDGMVGATFGQAADRATGAFHMMNVVVMRDEATWRAVDEEHHRVRKECLGGDSRERTTVPVGAGDATVTQTVLRGYPTSASDQVMRTAYVPGGRINVNEMTREPLDQPSPVPLEEFAAKRVPQLEAFIAEVTG